MYKDGIGTAEDLEMYRLYMRMAADKGSRDAVTIVQRWNRRNEKRQKTAEAAPAISDADDPPYPPVNTTQDDADKLYYEAMNCKPGTPNADHKRYRTLMRAAAEAGNETAIKLVAKWDARIKKRESEFDREEIVEEIEERIESHIRESADKGNKLARYIEEKWDKDT